MNPDHAGNPVHRAGLSDRLDPVRVSGGEGRPGGGYPHGRIGKCWCDQCRAIAGLAVLRPRVFPDLLKGLLPTIGFPMLVRAMTGRDVTDLPVMIALSAILGHNFPIYLNFQAEGRFHEFRRGLRAGLAASLGASLVFFVALRACGYVSLSSVLGAGAFVVVYFVHMLILRRSPWDREHIALTILILGLMVMLIVRHRKNWARIREGTEPRAGRRFRKPASGCVKVGLVVLIGVLAIASILAMRWTRPQVLDCGDFTLTDLGRVKTGHQRADRLVFADSGKSLGVLCLDIIV